MEEMGLEFRATKDVDMVLHIEALDDDFVSAFWDFIDEGGYQNRQKSTGKDLFFRFYSPTNPNFPKMLELFSRAPDTIVLKNDSHLTPIPTSESLLSLSAILLDEDYYRFTHEGKQEIGGISVVQASHLIPLKARAWIDLVGAKQKGTSIDEKNIRKHKNDIIRLFQILTPESRISLPQTIKEDMKKFIVRIGNEPVDIKNLGLQRFSLTEVIAALKNIYTL